MFCWVYWRWEDKMAAVRHSGMHRGIHCLIGTGRQISASTAQCSTDPVIIKFMNLNLSVDWFISKTVNQDNGIVINRQQKKVILVTRRTTLRKKLKQAKDIIHILIIFTFQSSLLILLYQDKQILCDHNAYINPLRVQIKVFIVRVRLMDFNDLLKLGITFLVMIGSEMWLMNETEHLYWLSEIKFKFCRLTK